MWADVLRKAGRIVVSLHVDDRLRGIARFQAVGHLRGLVRQGYLGGIKGVREPVGEHGYHGFWLQASASFSEHCEHDPLQRRLIGYRRPPLLAVPRRYAHIAYPPCRSTEGGERRPGRRPRRASQPPPASTWLALGYRFKPLVFTDQASEAAPQCPSAGPRTRSISQFRNHFRRSRPTLSSSEALVSSIVLTPRPRSTRKSPTTSQMALSPPVAGCRLGNRRSSWRVSSKSRL